MATAFRFVSSDDAGAPAASIAGNATLAQYITFIEAVYDYLLLQGASPWTKTVIDSRFTRYTMPAGSGRSFEIDHGATMTNGYEVRGVNTDGSKFPNTAYLAGAPYAWWRRQSSSGGDGVRNWYGLRCDRFMLLVLAVGNSIIRPSFGNLCCSIFGDHPASVAGDPHATFIIGGRASLTNSASSGSAAVMNTIHLDAHVNCCWPASPNGLAESPTGGGSGPSLGRLGLSSPIDVSFAPAIPMSEFVLFTRATATATSDGYVRGRIPFVRAVVSKFPNDAEDTFESGGVTYLHVGRGYALPKTDNEPGWT